MRAPPSPRPPGAVASEPGLLLALAACAAFGAWIATAYVARALAYAPSLGAPAYVASPSARVWWRAAAALFALLAIACTLAGTVGTSRRAPRVLSVLIASGLVASVVAAVVSLGPVYAPTAGLTWLGRFHHATGFAPVVQHALWVFGGTFLGALALVLAVRSPGPARAASTSHGSAAWGTGAELARADGLLLGRALADEGGRRWRRAPPLLRYAGEGHLLTVAPTRSGKGIGAVIPNLLTYPGGVLVTDPKGENYAVTARARRVLGQLVHVLDPFDAIRESSGDPASGPASGGASVLSAAFNPMDLLDATSPDVADDARLLADMLIIPEARASADHAFWAEEARALLTGLILHVASNAPPELRTLPHVRELLSLPPEAFRTLMADMLESDAVGGLVSRAAARHLQKADRERSGVVSSAQSHTHFLDSPRMARVLGMSTFDFGALRTAEASIYLVLPPERMETYARWLRLMVACGLLAMTRRSADHDRRRAPVRSSRHRVLFLLDEFAHLGRMQPVERDIGLVGGYGVTFWLLVQDLAQLTATYPEKWRTFLANCDVLQTFASNDWETADYLSRMTGETTVLVESENRSAGRSRGRHAQSQEGAGVTVAEQGRRLLTPDEVLRLARDEVLLFVRGARPVRARRLDYRGDPAFADLADANPMHTPPGEGVHAAGVPAGARA